MTKPYFSLAKLIAGILTFAIVIVLGVSFVTRFEQGRATQLIASLSEVTPGMTSRKSVQEIIKDESFLTRVPNVCGTDDGNGCDQFVFVNRWMVYLHLAPARWVWVTLDYRNGIVISKSVQFAEEPRRSIVTTQILRGTESNPTGVPTSARNVFINTSDFRNAMIKVSDDETVALEQRKKDWQIDLSCLSRFGACIDLRVILPEAFAKN